MIEVFKTDVSETGKETLLQTILPKHFPGKKINFDLDDCDRILRMEGEQIINHHVIKILNQHGYYCEVLEG
jgi:hypothetical protein